MRLTKIFFLICLSLCVSVFAQQKYDFGFTYSKGVPVMDGQYIYFDYPFYGGMNAMQFGRMDCNGDGIKDLVAFDVHGNRLKVFLQQGDQFIFAPHYSAYFPQLSGFMQLVDFDKDGKEDIFTYNNAGIKVYRNISDTIPKFELFTDRILSTYYAGRPKINLFCTPADYLVIQDLDGDGDVDILAFWSLGKYVDFHKNMSMERYGNCAYLDFEVVDRCWGHFSESGEDNQIQLNDYCSQSAIDKQKRHTGSTMLVGDFNGNGLFDLVLGDMDYPMVMYLQNGGTADSAHFIAVSSDFPTAQCPIDLYAMPCSMLLNISSDTLKDLLVSPFDVSYNKSENKESVWWYKNVGTKQNPDFQLQTKSFLQENMLDFGSCAFPIFADIDNDGLIDLLVGNAGYFDSASTSAYSLTCHYSASLAYLKNVGTAQYPEFKLITDDFLNLRSQGYAMLYPSVADLNGDGKNDILLLVNGNYLLYFENNTNNGQMSYHTPVPYFSNLSFADTLYSIQLVDINNNGLMDLLAGTKGGKLNLYINKGTAQNADFYLDITNLGGVDVRDYDKSYFGFATPYLFEDKLFVGTENGKIVYYGAIKSRLHETWTPIIEEQFYVFDNHVIKINEGIKTALTLADINQDGFPEMVVGNLAGGLSFFSGVEPPDITLNVEENIFADKVSVYPNPCTDYVFCENTIGEKIVHISIYNIVGQCLKNEKINHTFAKIDMQSWSAGVYFLFIKLQSNKLLVKKIVKY